MWGIFGSKINILDFSSNIFSFDLSEIVLNPNALLKIAVGHRALSDCKRFFSKRKFENSQHVGQFCKGIPSKHVLTIHQFDIWNKMYKFLIL